MNRTQCPNCNAFGTDLQTTLWNESVVQQVRTCDECNSQYTARFELVEREVDFTEEEDDDAE